MGSVNSEPEFRKVKRRRVLVVYDTWTVSTFLYYEHVLPVGFDGEFYLPLGRAVAAGRETRVILERLPNPTEAEIRRGISGNLCRCTGYVNIVKAIQYGAAVLRGETPVSTHAQSTMELSQSHA